MADYSVTITLSAFNVLTISPSSLSVNVGDRVRFRMAGEFLVSVTSGSVTGFNSGVWNSTSTYTLSTSYGSYRTVQGSGGLTDTLSTSVSGNSTNPENSGPKSGSKNYNVTIASSGPDQFDLGADISGVGLNTWFYSNTITVTGLSGSATARLTGLGNSAVQINGGSWQAKDTNYTVSAGDTLKVRTHSSSTYSKTWWATLTIGAKSDTWNVTTGSAATLADVYVDSPWSGLPIYLKADIAEFFGYDGSPTIRDYYRGGSLVPNVTQNNSIPTSGAITLSDFTSGMRANIRMNSFTQSQHVKYENASTGSPNTGSINATLTEGLTTNGWTLLYPLVGENLEIYVTRSVNASSMDGVTLSHTLPSGVSLNTWSPYPRSGVFKTTASWSNRYQIEAYLNATYTIKLRHKKRTTTETVTVTHTMLLWVVIGNPQ